MVPWFAKTRSPTHHHRQVREKKHAFTLLSNEHLNLIGALEIQRVKYERKIMSAKFRFIIILEGV